MPTPIIIAFEGAKSLTSMNSITLGVGVTWGSATIPLIPLIFTQDRMEGIINQESTFYDLRTPVNNEEFYNKAYVDCSTNSKHHFRGAITTIDRKVMGGAFGISTGGGSESEAATILVKGFKFLWSFFSNVNLAIVQDRFGSVSSNSLVHGINGENTYNLDVSTLSTNDNNVLIINAGAGAVVQSSVNILFIGKFPSIKTIKFPEHMFSNVAQSTFNPIKIAEMVKDAVEFDIEIMKYFWNVKKHAHAYAFIADASYGVILPGATISIFGS